MNKCLDIGVHLCGLFIRYLGNMYKSYLYIFVMILNAIHIKNIMRVFLVHIILNIRRTKMQCEKIRNNFLIPYKKLVIFTGF